MIDFRTNLRYDITKHDTREVTSRRSNGMSVQALVKSPPSESTFPFERVREVLRKELEEAAEESDILHEGWEPVLDSLRMVTVITALEDMFDFALPPEKVIRKGRYASVDQGLDAMADNLRRLWEKDHESRG
jgi:acyl carrier protein